MLSKNLLFEYFSWVCRFIHVVSVYGSFSNKFFLLVFLKCFRGNTNALLLIWNELVKVQLNW